MTKLELIKALEQFNDDAQVVVSFDVLDFCDKDTSVALHDTVALSIDCVDDGWKPSNVADIQLDELIMF